MHNPFNSNSFAASVRRNLAATLSGFDRLQRIEYAAPWHSASATGQRPDAAPAARFDARPIGLALIASLATVGVTLSALAAPAHAAERHRPPTAVVQTADLNLASSAGLATLNSRIAAAAKRACRLPGDSLPLNRSKDAGCEAAAIAAAQPQVRLAVARQRQVQFADRAD